MGKILDPAVEARIFTLRELKFSYSRIIAHLKKRGITVHKGTIHDVLHRIGKRRQARDNNENFQHHSPVKTPQLLNRLEKMCAKRNPLTQRSMASKLNCSSGLVNSAIHNDLGLVTRKKFKVHSIIDRHIKQRAKACKYLIENEVVPDRLEYIVTLDESWLYLKDCNQDRDICYREKGRRVPEDWTIEHGDSFGDKIMVVAVLTGRGVGPLFHVPTNVKICGEFYRDHVLKELIETHLPKIYPGEMHKIWIHHDAASSHTGSFAQNYMEHVTATIGARVIANEHIPRKGCDCSPLDFFGFGYLKKALKHQRIVDVETLWRAAARAWSRIDAEVVERVYQAWIRRLKLIVEREGQYIENVKTLHSRDCMRDL